MIVRIGPREGCVRPGRAQRLFEDFSEFARNALGASHPSRRSATNGFHPFRSLRTRLIVLISLPLLLVQMSVVWLDYMLGRARELADWEQRFAQQMQLAAADIDSELVLVGDVAATIAGLFADNPQLDEYQRHRVLRRNVETHPSIFGAAVVLEPWISRRLSYVHRPAPGKRVESLDLSHPNRDLRKQPWYHRARVAKEPFWIGPHIDRNTEATVLRCIAPMIRNGGFAGAVTLDLKAETLGSKLALSRAGNAFLALVDQSGAIMITANGSVTAKSLAELAESEDQPAYLEVARRIAAAEGGLERIAGRGAARPDRLLMHLPLDASGWSLLGQVSDAEALRDVRARLLRQGLLFGAGTAVVLMLVWGTATVATKPLKALAEAAHQVSEGRLDVRVEEPLPPDEIGQFSRVFNRMVVDLKDNVAARLSEAAARQAVESELAIALQIQRTMLPGPYSGAPAIEIAGNFLPARYVAGDFYDWFHVDENTVGLVIADVSGKGVPAALFMAVVRTSLRTLSADAGGPADTLTSLNRALVQENPLTVFVTVFYAHYHIPSGRLVYANAGHTSPYVVRADGAVESLGGSTGCLLAVFADAGISESSAELQPGDTLVLYTDGVIDASDPEGRFYDEKRLELVLKNAAGESPAEVCERINYAVSDHCQGALQDDVTLLVMRRNV